MERVNLLPDEARVSLGERLLRLVDLEFPRLLAWAVGSVAVIGGLSWLGQSAGLHRTRQRLEGLRKESELLRVESRNLESHATQLEHVEQEIQRQKQSLEWRLNYLQSAREGPRIWATVLKDLRRNIPYGMWLTEMESHRDGGLRIAGGTRDETLVTEFMSHLKSSPYFSDVRFSFTEKDVIGTVPIVKFEVVCRVRAQPTPGSSGS